MYSSQIFLLLRSKSFSVSVSFPGPKFEPESNIQQGRRDCRCRCILDNHPAPVRCPIRDPSPFPSIDNSSFPPTTSSIHPKNHAPHDNDDLARSPTLDRAGNPPLTPPVSCDCELKATSINTDWRRKAQIFCNIVFIYNNDDMLILTNIFNLWGTPYILSVTTQHVFNKVPLAHE